ncbi:class D sortase [Halalkalibacter krulwichiae]|uniref:Sortase family protein n=1 Tax=Halalkalibacter krulwichiae TaxID=199441 RepID=A0A1X9MGU0_9BACI|nr:class D sortase [Halalkalibacter krulwichiae]ARK32689.1 Sortase family protein [Halalkalibacter krulwichiae]
MRHKKLIFLLICSAIIGFGLWFSTTNAFKFVKGYYLFKTAESAVVEPVEVNDLVEEEESEDETDRPADSLYPLQPEKGDLMGELYIPKLEATLPIYHGTDEDELEKGVGHFAGSVLPGENDNSVLSGHRDTVFRRLGEVGENDLLIVRTGAGEFTYKVRKVRIVDEDDRTVIVPKPRATLTVSTCYPFDFIGSAPERYILVAELRGE